jgi:DNA-binding FrmR family transcriptional regulator
MSEAKTENTNDAQRQIRNRLKRAQGQLNAVIDAVDSGASCKDVVTQLAAVSHALNRAGFMLISNAMQYCVDNPDGEAQDKNGQPVNMKELEKLFLTLS